MSSFTTEDKYTTTVMPDQTISVLKQTIVYMDGRDISRTTEHTVLDKTSDLSVFPDVVKAVADAVWGSK